MGCASFIPKILHFEISDVIYLKIILKAYTN